jgi:outer membrane immunogenic protein
MNKYRGFLLATTSGLAAAGGAQAADLPTKMQGPPVFVPPAPSWEGLYVGLNAGAYWHHSDYNNAIGYDSSTNNTGFIGGGQIGYNWQHGNFVYGVEADISGLTGSGNASHGTTSIAKSITTRINWLSTFRGRFGLAVNDTMAYVTGGLAVGGVKNELINFSGPTTKSESKTRVGWVIGGGIEHMWTRNWTVGLEGLFVDLGHSTAVSSADPLKTTKFSNQAIIGRFKVNYKF